MSNSKPRNPIQAQLEKILSLLEQNSNVVDEVVEDPMSFWKQFAVVLNAIPGGYVKPAKAWMKTWYDLLHSVRQVMTLILDGHRLTAMCPNHVRAVDLAGYKRVGTPAKRSAEGSENAPSSGSNEAPNNCPPAKKFKYSGAMTSLPVNDSSSTMSSHPDMPGTSSSTSGRRLLNAGGTCAGSASEGSMRVPFRRSQYKAPSTATTLSSNVGSHGSNDRSSRLLKALEEKARTMIGTFMERFQASFQNQSWILQVSFEQQNRILLDNVPIIIRQELSVIMDNLPNIFQQVFERQGQVVENFEVAQNEQMNPDEEEVEGQAENAVEEIPLITTEDNATSQDEHEVGDNEEDL